MDGKTDMLKRY